MITESQIKPIKREVTSSQAMEKAFAADLAVKEKAREDLTEKEKTSLIAIKKYFFDKDSMYFSKDPEEVISKEITPAQIKDRYAGAMAILESGDIGPNSKQIKELIGITSKEDWNKLFYIALSISNKFVENKEKEEQEAIEEARKKAEKSFIVNNN